MTPPPRRLQIAAGHAGLAARPRAAAVAIGNFDGVHRGHQRLFAETLRHARRLGGEAVVLTFDPHPARVLSPRYAPPLIATTARKLELIEAAGIDLCVVEPFDRALAALSPEEFIEQVLVRALGAAHVCVGYDFTFGRDRRGDTALLGRLGASLGFGVSVLEAVTVEGIVCSSTKVREFVLEGQVEGAALLLGRHVEIEGTVEHGAGRGRTIGVPTANLAPLTELLPRSGVYAGWARLQSGAVHSAAINIGTNPTFRPPPSSTGPDEAPDAAPELPAVRKLAREARGGGEARPALPVEAVGGHPVSGRSPLSIEAHLLDFSARDLYGETVRLGLAVRLRDEARFSSVEALVEQIHRDIERSAEIGASRRPDARGAGPEILPPEGS